LNAQNWFKNRSVNFLAKEIHLKYAENTKKEQPFTSKRLELDFTRPERSLKIEQQ